MIRRGERNTVRWLSGATTGGGRGAVAIEVWSHASATWRTIEAQAPNTGEYEWATPVQLVAPLLMRVRAVGERGVEHVAQMTFQ